MSGRPPALAFALLLAPALVLAGCVSDTPAADVAPAQDEATGAAGPQAVVALVDTGINPYHVDFRDNSSFALVHPSQYLPGYPADAVAVNLTLDAKDLDAALKADKAVWKSLEPGVLYWFVGTKVSGYAPDDSYEDPDVGILFSTGHGTMTASRAAGNAYSLCPECRIVAVQGFSGAAVTWASEQPWIDAQSNSWSPAIVFQQADNVPLFGEPGLTGAFEDAATRHLVFGSAGNGVAGKLGVVGHPSFTRSTSGPRGVVSVGGHDNGDVILWSGSWPHVAADACDNWAAVGDTLDEYDAREGGGTSSASPYAAGEAARIVLEARRILGEHTAIEGGVLVGAGGGMLMVDLGDSPLQDGGLTLEEVKTLLMKTATPRPVKTEHDGESCGMGAAPYNTYPVAWSSIPEGAPRYPLVGYGQVSVDSLGLALQVLRGEAAMPDRADDDAWHARAETLREAYDALPN